MAAIFCLFSVSLCRLANIVPNDINVDYYNPIMPLSAQLVSVPRVYDSPCGNIFRYTFNGKEWFGLLSINNPAPIGTPSIITVILSVGVYLTRVSQSSRHLKHRMPKQVVESIKFYFCFISAIRRRDRISERQTERCEWHLQWIADPLQSSIPAAKSSSKTHSHLLQWSADMLGTPRFELFEIFQRFFLTRILCRCWDLCDDDHPRSHIIYRAYASAPSKTANSSNKKARTNSDSILDDTNLAAPNFATPNSATPNPAASNQTKSTNYTNCSTHPTEY